MPNLRMLLLLTVIAVANAGTLGLSDECTSTDQCLPGLLCASYCDVKDSMVYQGICKQKPNKMCRQPTTINDPCSGRQGCSSLFNLQCAGYTCASPGFCDTADGKCVTRPPKVPIVPGVNCGIPFTAPKQFGCCGSSAMGTGADGRTICTAYASGGSTCLGDNDCKDSSGLENFCCRKTGRCLPPDNPC
ncbi:hypothetical protein F5H01DRAFT_416215 [Linnemannia elongata]|nr:hypothetical protein F5H01DRAFT_416215 [Linnemannia elongata]